jgi:hypothetical protein
MHAHRRRRLTCDTAARPMADGIARDRLFSSTNVAPSPNGSAAVPGRCSNTSSFTMSTEAWTANTASIVDTPTPTDTDIGAR